MLDSLDLSLLKSEFDPSTPKSRSRKRLSSSAATILEALLEVRCPDSLRTGGKGVRILLPTSAWFSGCRPRIRFKTCFRSSTTASLEVSPLTAASGCVLMSYLYARAEE
jgi:hypothetical protein